MIVYKDYITFIILGKEINIISQDNILWTHNRMLTVAEIDENILYLGEHFPNINAAIMAYEKYFNYKLTPEQINQVMIDNTINKEKESTMTTKTTTKTAATKTTSKKTSSTKKPVTKKPTTKKTTASSTKKPTAKASATKKTVAKSSTKKAPAKKLPTKKLPVKKAPVKKSTSKVSSKKLTTRAVQSTTNVDRTGVVTVTTKS